MQSRAEKPFFVTTSWDDGHPSDLRLAELLDRYGMRGTFYVPTFNREGRTVMCDADVRALARGFEIGGHTRDHVVLTECTPTEAESQIRENRDRLSDLLGSNVEGFAYVRGKHNQVTRDIVRRLGFSYARTTGNFECSISANVLCVPVTIQFFPHSFGIRLRNLLCRGPSRDRISIMAGSARADTLPRACLNAALAARSRGQFFHLWGHSWELDEFGLWRELETFFEFLRYVGARHVDNATLVEALASSPPEAAGPSV